MFYKCSFHLAVQKGQLPRPHCICGSYKTFTIYIKEEITPPDFCAANLGSVISVTLPALGTF